MTRHTYIIAASRAVGGGRAWSVSGPALSRGLPNMVHRIGDHWEGRIGLYQLEPMADGGKGVFFVSSWGKTAKAAVAQLAERIAECAERCHGAGAEVRVIIGDEKTVPPVDMNVEPAERLYTPSLEEVAGAYWPQHENKPSLETRGLRLAVLARFDDLMTRLGAERVGDSLFTARYRLFTIYGEWSGGLDVRHGSVDVYSRWNEPDRVAGFLGVNQHSGKWNHYLGAFGPVAGGELHDFGPVGLHLLPAEGAALEREREAFNRREAIMADFWQRCREEDQSLTKEVADSLRADAERIRQANIAAAALAERVAA